MSKIVQLVDGGDLGEAKPVSIGDWKPPVVLVLLRIPGTLIVSLFPDTAAAVSDVRWESTRRTVVITS